MNTSEYLFLSYSDHLNLPILGNIIYNLISGPIENKIQILLPCNQGISFNTFISNDDTIILESGTYILRVSITLYQDYGIDGVRIIIKKNTESNDTLTSLKIVPVDPGIVLTQNNLNHGVLEYILKVNDFNTEIIQVLLEPFTYNKNIDISDLNLYINHYTIFLQRI